MVIFTASYFEPCNHHGQLVAISRSIPRGFKVQKQLKFLAPNRDLLKDWKQEKLSETEYIQRYREQITASWSEIKLWLDGLDPRPGLTLLCWEKQGEFCHRNLVAKLIQKYRPDLWGGSDVLHVSKLSCPHCSTKIIPGLGFSYCPCCKDWLKTSEIEPP